MTEESNMMKKEGCTSADELSGHTDNTINNNHDNTYNNNNDDDHDDVNEDSMISNNHELDETNTSSSDLSRDAASESLALSNKKEYKLHPLKDKWMVYYIVSSKGKEEYSQVTNELDYVSSIEEVFATMNTFPHPTLLDSDDSLVFARGKVDPQYESFPNGERVCIYCKLKWQCDAVVAPVLAAVLGESVTKEACDGNPVIGIVRIAHKYSPMFKESVRMEIWAHKSPYGKRMENYFIKLLEKTPTVQINLRKL